VAIFNNQASNGGGIDLGSNGRLTMLNCSMTGNTASSSGGALYAHNDTVVIINTSTITGNRANGGDGGAIYGDSRSAMLFTNSTITGNSASGSGGGIYTYGTGTLSTVSSTIARNVANNRGGGISADFGSVDLSNSTISGNSAQSGGGIYLGGRVGPSGIIIPNGEYYATGPAKINNCTITGNSVSGSSGTGTGGGIYSRRDVTMANTIVATNTATTDADLHSVTSGQGTSRFFSSFNLIQDKGGASVVDSGGTIFGVAPLLGNLGDSFGGSTPTIPLLTGSRGIDEGDPSFVGPPNTDQRGFPRVAAPQKAVYQRLHRVLRVS